MAEAFQDNLEGFKAYSDCCANHSASLEVLGNSANTQLQVYLDARNPSGELSHAVQSYLIKPVQRILKYPLLLRELTSVDCPAGKKEGQQRHAIQSERPSTSAGPTHKFFFFCSSCLCLGLCRSKLSAGTAAHSRLQQVLTAMSGVASHINEATRFTDALAEELGSNIPGFHLSAHMSLWTEENE